MLLKISCDGGLSVGFPIGAFFGGHVCGIGLPHSVASLADVPLRVADEVAVAAHAFAVVAPGFVAGVFQPISLSGADHPSRVNLFWVFHVNALIATTAGDDVAEAQMVLAALRFERCAEGGPD